MTTFWWLNQDRNDAGSDGVQCHFWPFQNVRNISPPPVFIHTKNYHQHSPSNFHAGQKSEPSQWKVPQKRSQTEAKKLSCAHSQGRLSHTNRQLKAARLKRGVNSGPAKMALITGLFPKGTKVGGFSTKFFRPTWFITIRQSSIEQWNLLNTL